MKLPRFLTNPRLPPDPGYWEDLDCIAGFYLLFFIVIFGTAYFVWFLYW